MLIYLHDQEDVPKLINLPFDQEDSWWGSVQACFASVALGAAIVATSLSGALAQTVTTGHQDDPVGSLKLFGTDEDFWQNPVAPVPATQYVQLPLGDPEEIPAHTLSIGPLQEDTIVVNQPIDPQWTLMFFLDDGTAMPGFSPEEDLWQQTSLVPPVPATQYLNFPYWFDQAEFQFVAAFPEEDLWQNPTQPVPATFGTLYLPDPEELSAATLLISLEEDLWQNRVAPVDNVFTWPQPFGFDQPELVRAFIPDDTADWFRMFPAPVPATMFGSLPIQLPFGTLDNVEGDSVLTPIVVIAGNGDVEINLNGLEIIIRGLNHL